ncbi:MAG: hypothetical protein F4X82_02435 [Candidatus Spechtbacteria bacterium SB0662_bin_43]|uniref:Uncharacterized protein n=1 Tax=Candidatus Spechtbacteria bacterium SB0662_bin_43 TaxID=2604897 RepID=A0A845DAG6_9BACT|nr:hypothetical protein [Candidatus Spechtbacteria bacterium SB0662_bin_43]
MKYLSSFFLALGVFSLVLSGAATTLTETASGQEGIVKCGTKKVDEDGNPVWLRCLDEDGNSIKSDNCDAENYVCAGGKKSGSGDDTTCIQRVQAENPTCGFRELGSLILDITQKIIYQFTPLLVIAMITLGGFTILIAREDPGMYQRGIQFIKYALIGYVIVLLSFLIVEVFLFEIMGVNGTYGIRGWGDITSIFGGSST